MRGFLREHLELDERTGQGVVVRLDERSAADAEIDDLRPALAVWLPGMRDATPRALLGLGWAASFAALGCAFAGWRTVLMSSVAIASDSASTPGGPPTMEMREPTTAAAAPWLLIAALALIAGSLLVAL